MITSIDTVTQVSIKFSDVILFEFMMIFFHVSFLICVSVFSVQFNLIYL